MRSIQDDLIMLNFIETFLLQLDSGVQPSLHPNYHHKMVHTKFDLKINFPHLTNESYGITDKGTLNLLENLNNDKNKNT